MPLRRQQREIQLILLTDVHTNGTDSYDACLTIRVPITLDLNEHTIYSPDNMSDNEINIAALHVIADTTLKATTGGIDTGKNGGYAIDVYKDAKLTIDGGKYYGGGTAVQVEKGELTINDGYFDAEAATDPYGYDFIINCIDGAYKDGTAKVAIKGGYFAHFNPANNKAEGAGTNFVADGYVSVTSDKSGYDYKVVQKTDTGSIVVKPAVAEPEVNVDKISESDKARRDDWESSGSDVLPYRPSAQQQVTRLQQLTRQRQRIWQQRHRACRTRPCTFRLHLR